MIAPLLYAPNHQHFFNIRLDMGIDGAQNTVQQLDVVADPFEGDNVEGNAFHLQATNLTTEKQAMANLNLDTGRTWKFINPSVKNAMGNPVGYKFFPGDNAMPLALPNAWWRKRALCGPSRVGYAVL